MPERSPVDMDAYIKGIQTRPCFICRIVAKDPAFVHHIVYEDDFAIVFLNKYPTLRGYTLVCPKKHREQVTGDFTLDEYLRLQRLIYDVSEALSRVLPCERLYICSLGSQQGNRHVHWHVAPLPPGIPFEDQQFEALRLDRGVLPLSHDELADLAHKIAVEMSARHAV
jgi:diadenosine tetraphosphate (Ap4A) HIT family hydrolase